MPPKRSKRFALAAFVKANDEQATELSQAARKRADREKELKAQQQRIRRLNEKISNGKDKYDALQENIQAAPNINNITKQARPPTSLHEGNYSAKRTLVRRRRETLHSAFTIHGGSLTNKRPAFDGLFDTLNKKCKIQDLGNYVLSNDKLTSYVIDQKQKIERLAFEKSKDNVLRSISTYYTAGVMGKRKYQAVRLSSSMKYNNEKRTAITFLPKCPIPKLVTYNTLAKEIKSIDIGTIYDIKEEFKDYIAEDENMHGCFRDLREYLPRLAKFYLSVPCRAKVLNWFGKTEGTFLVAFGGDGCPFGKNETACSFLLSFINAGKRIASSSDNFLTFGGNCEETSLVVKKYVLAVCKQMADLKGKLFEINGLSVTFSIEELPNDMKMLAMLGGELNNAASYFSTFGNVCQSDMSDLQGKYGADVACKWKPWVYSDRVKVAADVEKFKATLKGKSGSDKTKRGKVTEYISKRKSRQEFVPLVCELIDKAHVEPLHLKNNAWQYFFKSLLKEAIAKSKLQPSSCKLFSNVPIESCFAKVVCALQYEVKATRLAGKVKRWYDETQGSKGDMTYRFTGKDSRLFCHNFMRLIKSISQTGDNQKQRQFVLALAYIGLKLRDCCSIFNRFKIDEGVLATLSSTAREYYRANALFMPTSVNPTIWTIGHVVPVHTKYMFDVYGQGLLTVTMEGREAKHIALQRLSRNTTYQRRWEEIFRHEYIMLVWLPEYGHEPCSNTPSKNVYIPQRVFNDTNYCYCGLEKANESDLKCSFCGDNLTTLIDKSVRQGNRIAGLVF